MLSLCRTLSIIGMALLMPLKAYSDEQCPQINCDCDILPYSTWKTTCQNHEKTIKKECVRNGNTPQSYCSVHGPRARPLPLDIRLSSELPDASESTTTLNKNVAYMYWSLFSDFDTVKEHMEQHNFVAVNEMLDLVEKNIETLFKTQQKIVASWLADNNKNEIRKAWLDYSEDTLTVGNDFFEYGDAIWKTKADKAALSPSDKTYYAISMRLVKISGTAFEHAGYAFANAMRHKKAANAWKNAAQASSIVASDTDLENSDYYRFQTAARLHRASYHWVVSSGRGSRDAGSSLEKSQKFMNDGASLNVLVQDEKSKQQENPY